MSSFIGRARELAALKKAYEGERSAFVVVYGRRRVGKSALLQEFFRGHAGRTVYYVGKHGPPAVQIAELLREAAAALSAPLLGRGLDLSWKEALQACVEQHTGKGKLILALDEFQWIAAGSPELSGVLQELWDRDWQHSGRVLLVLCGSYIGFMEREVLGRRSPLFGRRTAQILLRPFGYLEAARFHPGFATVEKARAYFVCGGVPHYLQQIAKDASVESSIADSILDEHGPLFREADFLLREELRDVESYLAVLLALAESHAVPAILAQRTGLGESAHYYLKQLVELGYVERVFPLTRGRPKRTDVRYGVADPLLRFWFRFVYPNLSFLQSRGGRRGLRERVKPLLPAYFGGCFERLCREAVPLLHEREGVGGFPTVGNYWSKDVQIDVVALREDGWIDLGECKWSGDRSGKAVLRELDGKVPRYPNPTGATLLRRVFTRQAPSAASSPHPMRWHTLEDLYTLEMPRW